MLEHVQQWMYGVIADGSGVEAAPDHILPSRALTAAERVLIYNGMYLSRFAESLQVDYPALAHYLGEGRFHDLVARYVEKHPSTSYTLNRLGDSLPDFLSGFERDLARLELAMTLIFDEEETPPADLTQLPANRAERMRLVPVEAMRLLSLNYNSNECFQAYRDGLSVRPRRAKNYLLVHRKDYSVYRTRLTRRAYEFLLELMAEKTIGDAILAVRPSQHELFEWFRDWSAAGLFRSFGE